MPRKKKAVFVPKKKKTLIAEPNWEKLRKAKTEDEMLESWKSCDDYAHFELTDKEMLHGLKRWIETESGWDLVTETKTIPDVYLLVFAKHGWKARQLGFTPKAVRNNFEKNLKPLLLQADELRKSAVVTSQVDVEADANWHPSKVKEWLKKWQDYLKSITLWKESSDAKLRMQYQVAETYVYNLNQYLRNGVWCDTHWGENREYKVMNVCKALAYDENGTPKRIVGVYYPDIGQLWTKEMDNASK